MTGYVALTYDDGPHTGSTQALLDALHLAGARATFFMIGAHVQRYPRLVRSLLDAGMWLGNHTWNHPHLPTLTVPDVAEEIRRTQEAIERVVGSAPTLFRPPYGDTNAQISRAANEQGMTEVLWTVDTKDWDTATTTAQIVEAADSVRPGGIILMHDGGYDSTVAAVPHIVRNLAARDLRPGRIVTRDGVPVVVAP